MHIEEHKGKTPKIASTAKIFANVAISGDVTIGEHVSIWYNASLRGDMAPITIGSGTNIQDNAIVHTNLNLPTHIGKNVTVGHGAIIHAATVKDNCLIGMGSIILDGAVVEEQALVAAGCVVPPNKTVPSRMLVVGNPMKIVRALTTEEIEGMKKNKDYYITLMNEYE